MATVYAGGTLRPHDPDDEPFTYAMPLLEHDGSFHDSGFDDPISDQRKHDITTELADWKDTILKIWYENNRRVASDMEIVLFRGLLQAPEECIRARLRQLFEDGDRLERGTNSLQSVTGSFSDDISFQSSQSSCINSESAVLYPWSAVDNSELSEGGLNYGSAVGTQKTEHIEIEFSAQSTIVPQTENASCYYSNDSRSVPVPAFQSASDASSLSNMMGPAASSLNTDMDQNPASRLPYRLPSFDGDSCQLNSLYNIDFIPYATQSTAPITTEALMRLVGSVIHGKRLKGCGAIRDHENQRGMYACTLGCGRRFRTSCDLFRHEETVYPQHFWFCFHCGDPHEPSERHLFTREDKIRHHIKHAHPDMISVSNCRIPNARTTFPNRCTLCLHHKHRTWKDRCKHIIMHIRRGEDPPVIDRRRRQEESQNHNGDGGDDGDDNDNNDGNDSDTEDEDDDSNGNEDPRSSDTEGSSDYSYQDLPKFPEDSTDGDWSHGLFNFDDYCGTTHTSSSPSEVFLERLDDPVKFQPAGIKSGYHSIGWIERINNKGATATMFKVNLASDLESTEVGTEVNFAVKQYQEKHLGLFKQELQAFKDMYANGVDPEGIIHCYGTFEYRDALGHTYYNLLLEYAECDLREYWADTLPPRTATEITEEWSKLLGIARALKHIQGATTQDKYVPFGWHGDIKPDNILVVDGRLKLADFGFATIQGSREHRAATIPIRGGTVRYRAPELYGSRKAKSRQSSSGDAWSLGCVFSEAATWILMGFAGLQEFRLRYDFRMSKPSRKSRHKFLRARDWHRRLLREIAEHDLVTAKILDVTDKHLLQVYPRLRIPMFQLCDQLHGIIRTAKCWEPIRHWLRPRLDKSSEQAETTLAHFPRKGHEDSAFSFRALPTIEAAAVDWLDGSWRLSDRKDTCAGTKEECNVGSARDIFLVIDAGGGTSDILTIKTILNRCAGEISDSRGFDLCSTVLDKEGLPNYNWSNPPGWRNHAERRNNTSWLRTPDGRTDTSKSAVGSARARTRSFGQEDLLTREDYSALSKRNITKHEKTHFRPWKCTKADIGWPTKKEWVRHENDQHSVTPAQYKCLYPPCTYASKRESNCKQHMEKAHGWTHVLSKSNGRKKDCYSNHASIDEKGSDPWSLDTATESVMMMQHPNGAETKKTQGLRWKTIRGRREAKLTAEQRSHAALMRIAGPCSTPPRQVGRVHLSTRCEACLSLVTHDQLSGWSHPNMAKRCPNCHHVLIPASNLEEISSSNAIHRPRIKRKCKAGTYSRPVSHYDWVDADGSHYNLVDVDGFVPTIEETRRLFALKYDLTPYVTIFGVDTANMAEKIAPRLDQYLSGRQEKPTHIDMWIEGDPDSRRSNELRQLFSEFWHSRRRRSFKHNLQVRFVVSTDIDFHGSQLEKLAKEFPFVSIAHASQGKCNGPRTTQEGLVTVLEMGEGCSSR